LRLNIAPSGSCAADNTRPDEIGNPPPDSNVRDKGRPEFDGEGGVNANCTISGDGPFQVTASVAKGSVILGIEEGVVQGNGTGTARMSFTTPAIGRGSIGNGTCSLTAVSIIENGMTLPGVKAGALWGTFNCTGLTQQGTPSLNCTATGEILLENCRQN